MHFFSLVFHQRGFGGGPPVQSLGAALKEGDTQTGVKMRPRQPPPLRGRDARLNISFADDAKHHIFCLFKFKQ